ncbi:MAG: DUF4174 domain-containing protein [Pseudomonadota bacterium]
MRAMKLVFWVFLAGLVSPIAATAQSVGLAEAKNPLLKAQWNHRLVIVCEADDGVTDPVLATAQYEAAFEDWPGYIERDLILVWVSQDDIMTWYPKPHRFKAATLLIGYYDTDETNLRGRTGCDADTNFVALIGKDGDVKAKSASIISNNDLFALIDAMPMRLQEMRRGSE